MSVQGIVIPKWDEPLDKETEKSLVNYRGFSRTTNLNTLRAKSKIGRKQKFLSQPTDKFVQIYLQLR